MRLHQAFIDALPLQKLITSDVEWSTELKLTPNPKSVSEVFYFPIGGPVQNKILRAQGNFPINESSDKNLVNDWVECCNILIGQMLTMVEEQSYLRGPRYLSLDLYSPVKEISMNLKAASGHELGKRILRFKNVSIPTEFTYWEMGSEKMTYMTNTRSVYDLDNR
jgi:hypothetical protein